MSFASRRPERATAAIAKLRRQGKTDHLGSKRKVFDRDKARKMHNAGTPLRDIAEQLGVSAMTIQRVVAVA
jgi:IS30 family transposase